ncbi:MAG TPA: nuclear transport factor 2 family protein [Pyrinomonadaceae bacterium]|nr:nuclear transport factor 2 family protein [Pyrinomonadaceae bacterium]
MKRNLLVIAMTIMALTIALGRSAAGVQDRPTSNDEEALKKLVHDWAMCTVQGDSANLEKFMDDNFRGNAEGISFNKKMLLAALKSGQMKVGAWTIDDAKVSVRGNSASVTGRSTLSNATYMGKDFSGQWDWTDRFVKQRDGSWRAVSSQSKRLKT